MYNQKRIKKIMKCTREGSYDELLNYMIEVNSAEDLIALREHKIIQYIVDNTKEEKILKSYLERIKIIDNRHYVHEKNYIKLLKVVKKKLCEISKKINDIVQKIDSFSSSRNSYFYYIQLIEEVKKYQRFYRIRDEVTYNKYYGSFLRGNRVAYMTVFSMAQRRLELMIYLC